VPDGGVVLLWDIYGTLAGFANDDKPDKALARLDHFGNVRWQRQFDLGSGLGPTRLALSPPQNGRRMIAVAATTGFDDSTWAQVAYGWEDIVVAAFPA